MVTLLNTVRFFVSHSFPMAVFLTSLLYESHFKTLGPHFFFMARSDCEHGQGRNIQEYLGNSVILETNKPRDLYLLKTRKLKTFDSLRFHILYTAFFSTTN